jgi:SAM-dependent methyltransferase
MNKIKINLGCGTDYKKGWINVDFNKEVNADVYADFKKRLPFPSNYADYILIDNVLEHVERNRLFPFLEELHRICKKGAILEIFVPHYSGMYAFKHPTHYNYFGINSFSTLEENAPFNGERYTKARFRLVSERLLFFHHNLVNTKLLSKLPINWLFNFSKNYQLIMERFQFLGFDEIRYVLKKI